MEPLARGWLLSTLVGRVPLAIDRRAPHRLDLEDVDHEGWLLASARRRSAAGDVSKRRLLAMASLLGRSAWRSRRRHQAYHPAAEVRRADTSVVAELMLRAVRVGHGRVLALAAWVGSTLL
eukprot:scaffold9547_cov52-Phaeocystis_antarctica.AAC.3